MNKKATKISDLAKLGLAPPKKKKIRIPLEQCCNVIDWAEKHHLLINPASGYSYSLESFNMFNACPCDDSRKSCPCPESVKEVLEQGHCKCRLFWRDLETFKEIHLKGSK